MGKGDIKTKKGKRFNSSFGKHRKHKVTVNTATTPKKKAGSTKKAGTTTKKASATKEKTTPKAS